MHTHESSKLYSSQSPWWRRRAVLSRLPQITQTCCFSVYLILPPAYKDPISKIISCRASKTIFLHRLQSVLQLLRLMKIMFKHMAVSVTTEFLAEDFNGSYLCFGIFCWIQLNNCCAFYHCVLNFQPTWLTGSSNAVTQSKVMRARAISEPFTPRIHFNKADLFSTVSSF